MLEKIKTPETKPFYLTTEFWAHAVLQLLTWVGTLPTAGMPGGKTTFSIAAFVGYALSRGLAKSGSPFEQGEAALSALLHNNGVSTAPTDLPTQAGDIQPQWPPGDAAGVKGVDQPAAPTQQIPAAAAPAAEAVQTGITDLAAIAAKVREVASEHPEVIQQLKSEGIL